MTVTSYSLTPESASIQPEPQDFETIEREFGPLPLDATEKEAAHRSRTTYKNSKAIISGKRAGRAIGASFIGLEVAVSLRVRDIEVRVVGTETVLMEKVLEPQAP